MPSYVCLPGKNSGGLRLRPIEPKQLCVDGQNDVVWPSSDAVRAAENSEASGKQVPFAGKAFEFVRSALGEMQACSRHEVGNHS
jgi:hypothetical protein